MIRPFILAAAVASPALGQAAPVDAFSQIPGATYFAIDNPSPCGAHFRDPFVVTSGGVPVTVSYYSETSTDHQYLVGCTNWSDPSWDHYRAANDAAIDPGNFIGDYNSAPAAGGPANDLILNFSAPIAAFGTTSILAPFNSADADTIVAYDGPNGAGNVLATVTTAPAELLVLKLDFVGVVAQTAAIRSVRYVNAQGSHGFSIDGIAIAALPPPSCGSADFNGDGDLGTDADIGAFFSCLGGGCCPACDPHGADFNGDGNLGTDADIESFFRVLGGGPC